MHLKRFSVGVCVAVLLLLAVGMAVRGYGVPEDEVDAAPAGGGITDPTLVLTPAPLPNPAYDTPVSDPVFGTTIRRVTDDAGQNGFGTHIYSQLQAFSGGNEYLLLYEETRGYVVRRVSDLSLMPVSSAGWNAPRWQPAQPHTIIHYDSNDDTTLRVQTTDVETGQTTTVFTFPAPYQRIRSNQSFDELSRDGRWMAGMAALADGDQMLFALDLDTMSLGAELRLSTDLYAGPCEPDPEWGEVEPDWIGVSPLGNTMVVQWQRDGTTRCSGLETFDLTTGTFVGRVYDGHQHGDLGVMADGTTEFFMTFELYHPSGNLALGYRELPGTTPVQEPTYVQTMDWHGDHISCQGPAGVCLVTTWGDPGDGWSALEGEVFLQYLDGSVLRLAHHRSSGCGYWVQPRASLSRDGRFAVFASDWAYGSGGDSCGNLDLGAGDPYLVDLGGDPPPPEVTPDAFAYLPTVLNRAGDGETPLTATPSPTPSPTPTATATPDGDDGATFSRQPIDTNVQHGQHVNVVDVDEDGDQDVILSLSLDDAITLYLNNGNGSSWTPVAIAPADTIVAMETAVVDVDGDGDLDVAAVGLFDRGPCGWGSGAFCEEPGVVSWYENPGTVTGSWTRHDVATNLWGARTIAAADLTGNGLPDLIVGTVALFGQPDGLYWYRHNESGDPWTAVSSIDETLADVEGIAAHDVDDDGVPDLVAVGKSSNEIAWYENGRAAGSQDSTPDFAKHVIAAPANPYAFHLADMDGDAALELVATGNDGVHRYDPPADPAAAWSGTAVDAGFGGGDNARPWAADFDGDGDVDVAVSSNVAAALRWYERDGADWIGRDIGDYAGVTGLMGGDLDGNGRFDLVTTTYANPSGSDRVDWWRNQ